MKVAIVHYWLVTMRGGEKVVEQLCQLYPNADIFTHVVARENISPAILSHNIQTSFISRLPGAARHYQKYLPFMPAALEQFDLRDYDLVISSESGPTKGVITNANTLHICYCHTPMRYLWNMYQDYLQETGPLTRAAMIPIFNRLRQWDFASSARVDYFVANSTTVSRRIAKVYRRHAEVIHPPVSVERFAPAEPKEYYLACGQLVPYKRFDVAIEAFNRLGKPLMVVGEGSEFSRLKKLADPNIVFLGRKSDQELQKLYAECRALIFPGEEDFGIVPVEAMASGRPVIGYNKGGIRDTVKDGVHGVLFDSQTAESLTAAVERLERTQFSFREITNHAATFSAQRFREKFSAFVESKLSEFRLNGPPLR